MAFFKISHQKTSYNEGGFQIMEDDNGNWTGGKKGVGNLVGTKYGISAPVLKAYLKREPTVADMKALTRETADKIYLQGWWNQIRGDEIESQEAADQIYDMAVNAGVETAIMLCQRELGLHETGTMDTITLNALNNKV